MCSPYTYPAPIIKYIQQKYVEWIRQMNEITRLIIFPSFNRLTSLLQYHSTSEAPSTLNTASCEARLPQDTHAYFLMISDLLCPSLSFEETQSETTRNLTLPNILISIPFFKIIIALLNQFMNPKQQYLFLQVFL